MCAPQRSRPAESIVVARLALEGRLGPTQSARPRLGGDWTVRSGRLAGHSGHRSGR